MSGVSQSKQTAIGDAGQEGKHTHPGHRHQARWPSRSVVAQAAAHLPKPPLVYSTSSGILDTRLVFLQCE